MPPSEQERRCVEAVYHYLRVASGSVWRIEDWLDDRHTDEPSPDVLLTDGTGRLAMEVKQLTDGVAFDAYDQAQQSLYRRLAPNATNVFTLIPPPLATLPLAPVLVSQIKTRIATAANGLQVGNCTKVLNPAQGNAQIRESIRPRSCSLPARAE